MKIAFAGTPAFAATALAHLVHEGFDVALVMTQPDRPAGRGQKLQASAVKQLALAHGLRVAQPQGLKLDGRFADDARATQTLLAELGVDAIVVVAYGLILPGWVLSSPKLGCFNIHGSLLPRWRGAAPIQRAIEAGDAQTGITIIQMDAGLDTGDMLAAESVAIAGDDTSQTVHDRLAPVGARLVAQVLREAHAGALRPVKQPAVGATYAAKIDKTQALIDWQEGAAVIERRVRAFDPAPGCSFERAGDLLKLWRARVVEPTAAVTPAAARDQPELSVDKVGQLRRHGSACVVTCGDGHVLELLEVQKPGGRRGAAGVVLSF
jgi:methionyl-tRNA formyltransferase